MSNYQRPGATQRRAWQRGSQWPLRIRNLLLGLCLLVAGFQPAVAQSDPTATQTQRIYLPIVQGSGAPGNSSTPAEAAVLGCTGTPNNLAVLNTATTQSDISDPNQANNAAQVCVDKPVATLGDRVWNDTNRNGLQDAGEPGVLNVTVALFSNCIGNTIIGTTTTDANGIYGFTGLNAGQYRVQISLPAGFQFSPQNQGANDAVDSDVNIVTGISDCITLSAGQNDPIWDAGIFSGSGPTSTPTTTPVAPTPTNTPASGSGSVGDRVWNDTNGNGIQDGGEPGVPNVSVALLKDCGGNLVIATTTTDANGIYTFANLTFGQYRVQVSLPAGFQFSPQNQGANDAVDSDVNIATGISDCITLSAGQNDPIWDAGIASGTAPTPTPSTTPVAPTPTTTPVAPTPTNTPASGGGSVGDRVWNDTNGNGIQDGGEPGVPNVSVALLKDCGGNLIIATTTTDANGIYNFANLTFGQYRVQVSLPAGFQFSPQNQGANDAVDSDVNIATGISECITLSAGQNDPSWDAGISSGRHLPQRPPQRRSHLRRPRRQLPPRQRIHRPVAMVQWGTACGTTPTAMGFRMAANRVCLTSA